MSEQDSLLRKICDKQVLDAVCLLKSVNKEKGQIIENKLIQFYNKNRTLVDFQEYLKLIKDIDLKTSIVFQRKKDCYDLDEISE